ncbi:MAG: hypothetical protein Q9221_005871 [Calogaya cf. arnoldii]
MVQPFGNNTTTAGAPTWVPEPQARGTWSILSSCIITLSLYVWSAVHINIPKHQTWVALYWRRAKWLLLGLFAPELVAYIAWQQRQEASKLCREVRAMYGQPEPSSLISRLMQCFRCQKQEEATDELHPATHSDWRLVHGFFVNMGGFDLAVGPHESFLPNGIDGASLTSEGFKFFLEHRDHLVPNITASQIWERSKADRLSKTLVCVQSIWFCTQCITRLGQSLPISLLELNTFGHALCTLMIYFFWWDKPLDIGQPVVITTDDQPILAYKWMSSKVSVQDYCSADMPSGLQNEFHAIWPFERPVLNDLDSFEVEIPGRPKFLPLIENTMEDLGTLGPNGLPIASYRLREGWYPPIFQIFQDGPVSRVDNENTRKKRPVSFILRMKQELHSFFYPSKAMYGIPPGLGTRKTAISHFCHADVARWSLCADAIRRLSLEESLCSRHRWAMSGWSWNIMFGIPIRSLDVISNEHLTSLLEQRSRDATILSLATSDNSPGFAIAGALYGALHLVAWSAPFPSPLEQLLWRIAATSVAGTGITFALLAVINKKGHNIAMQMQVEIENRPRITMIRQYSAAIALGVASCVILPCVLPLSILYLASRGFLIVESLINVAFLPSASFKMPEWPTYFPHIS